MGSIPIVFYKEIDGSVPFLEWFEQLPEKVQYKCRARLEQLSSLGHELRRPAADYLRDGIYELRARAGSTQYRILYFFHGRIAAVLAHGITKEGRVPDVEIERAVRRKAQFVRDPDRHRYREGQA